MAEHPGFAHLLLHDDLSALFVVLVECGAQLPFIFLLARRASFITVFLEELRFLALQILQTSHMSRAGADATDTKKHGRYNN